MAPRGIALRLFLTCWVVFSLHVATDFAREHYLVVSIAERGTFRLDEYHRLHPDIFRLPNGHAYHGANPGVSMMAAVPYFLLRPITDRVVQRVVAGRVARGDTASVEFQDLRPARVRFYREVRKRGLDIKFGLVGLITMVFFMAPLSAFGAVMVYRVFLGAGVTRRAALGGSLFYALGTPIFFRTGYLNQNLAVAIFGFAAFALLWNPGGQFRLTLRSRQLWAGVFGGLALLCDYSGALALGLCGIYAVILQLDRTEWRPALKGAAWYTAGAVGPILLLWFYQWAAFGSPFLPPQHHMPPVEWSDLGYQGITAPQSDLFWTLLLDPRFGLFITAPALVLGLFAPWLNIKRQSIIPWRETAFLLAVSSSYLIFFSAVQYTQLQYITGIRYVIPVMPFLAVLTVAVLLRIPRWITWPVGVGSFALAWAMAMVRVPYPDRSVLGVLKSIGADGLQLPLLTTLSKTSARFADGTAAGIAPLLLLALGGAIIVAIWRVGSRRASPAP
jgi:hypothetical protein